MALKFNPALVNLMLSDEIALRELQECHDLYTDDDKSALLRVVIACARFQAVIPDWAVDEFLKLEQSIDEGDVNNLNDFFGFTPGHKGTIQKNKRLCENESKIYAALVKHRLDGKNFNVADGFDALADEIGVSRRDVEDTYKKHADTLKKVPKNSQKNFGYFDPTIWEPAFRGLRRRGRQPLKD